MHESLTSQLFGVRYRLLFVIFGILMSIGSFLTDYLFASGFFLVVAAAVGVTVVQKLAE